MGTRNRTHKRYPNGSCENCDTPIYIRPGEGGHHYCSVYCYRTMQARKKPRNCILCGVNIKPGADSRVRFCSHSCSNRSRRGISYDGTQAKNRALNHKLVRIQLIELRGEKCVTCGLGPLWIGNRIVLQIDHIDGDRLNNHLDNLRFLCPNCHSQTETYGSPKSGRRY